VWEKLAKAFDGEKSVVIAKVDADKHKSLGSRFGVQGFPTLKFFPAKVRSTARATGLRAPPAGADGGGGRHPSARVHARRRGRQGAAGVECP